MYKIEYTAEKARADAERYNNSLEKALAIAESAIQYAASQGYSGCSLTQKIDSTKYKDVAAALRKVGYQTDYRTDTFAVYW